MVGAKNFRQNNWGYLSKKLNLGGDKFKEGPKILGGESMNIVGKGAHNPHF